MIDRYKRQALALDVIDFEEHVEIEETFDAEGNRMTAKIPGSETAFIILQAPDGEVIRVQMPHAQFDDIIRRVFPYDFEGMPVADFVIDRLKKEAKGLAASLGVQAVQVVTEPDRDGLGVVVRHLRPVVVEGAGESLSDVIGDREWDPEAARLRAHKRRDDDRGQLGGIGGVPGQLGRFHPISVTTRR